MRIKTVLLSDFTVAKLSRMEDVIDFAPPYQREGDVWSETTRQGLIDSIINGLDLPKLYFERATTRRLSPAGLTVQYAVLDGKQRLQAILEFMRGKLKLPADFWFFEDRSVQVQGWTLFQLQESYPELASRFTDFELPIVSVTSDSGDLIEEMFQRLNASSALNAAERRNAVSGPTRTAANQLAGHKLLVECSPIRSARYKYRELGAKFLAIEHQLVTRGKVQDTKASTLLKLFKDSAGAEPSISAETMEGYKESAEGVLNQMYDVFDVNDLLLGSIGTVVVYYMVFRCEDAASHVVDRAKLSLFEDMRRAASRLAEDDDQYAFPANARLREYNVLVQSTNDGTALERRGAILSAFVEGYVDGAALTGLEELGPGPIPDGGTDEDGLANE